MKRIYFIVDVESFGTNHFVWSESSVDIIKRFDEMVDAGYGDLLCVRSAVVTDSYNGEYVPHK